MNFRNFTVLDLETTGFSPAKDRVTQLAMVTVIEWKIWDSHLVSFDTGSPVPEKIKALTCAHEDELKFHHKIELQGITIAHGTIVAHNAEFDKRFCKKFLPGIGSGNAIWWCSLAHYRKKFPGQSHKLQDLIGKYLTPTERTPGAHSAVSDALNLAKLLLKVR